MTDDPEQDDGSRIDDRAGVASDTADVESDASYPGEHDGVACTEAYEQDDVVVLYDAENPLAWVEADTAVRVDRMV
jgi:hypothetical protein